MHGSADEASHSWQATVAGHKEQQLLRIGRAAADLATTEGLPAVSMSRLAKAVGVSRATLYNYVPDVATAIRLYLQEQSDAFHRQVTTAIAGEVGPEAQLRRYITEQVAYVAGTDHQAAVALAEAGAALGNSETDAAHRRRGSGVLDQILADGVEVGIFRQSDPAQAILINRLLYSAHELLHHHHLSQQEAATSIADLVLDGILPHEPATTPTRGRPKQSSTPKK